MKRLLSLFSFFFVFFVFSARAQAPITAELIAEKEGIFESQEMYISLKLTLSRGWHVYWKNSGDAGEPTELKLNLPDGFAEIERFYPFPERFSIGTMAEYGYSRQAYLLVKIRSPEGLPPDETVEITGRATWLACKDECVPMSADVSLFLLTGVESETNTEISKALAFVPSFVESDFFETETSFVLRLPAEEKAKTAYFFPSESGEIMHAAPQLLKVKDGKAYVFTSKSSKIKGASLQQLTGTVVFYNVQGEPIKSFDVKAERTQDKLPVFDMPFVFKDFIIALVFAFAGGFLLNLMPCVFPVLSLKAFTLVSSGADKTDVELRHEGLAYTGGVLLSFLCIGGALVALRSLGTELGWGFQLQYPPFVLILCLFVFFLALLFSEVLAVGNSLSNLGNTLGRHWGSFGTGVLAVFVATPCAAPFMGAALGYGLMSPPLITMAVFFIMGLGLSLPFLLLGFYPSLGRFMPKSGPWMVLFRRFLAFPLYATAAWLLWVLAAQEGSGALAIGLICLVFVGLTAWLFGEAQKGSKFYVIAIVVGTLSLIFIGLSAYDLIPENRAEKVSAEIKWQSYEASSIQMYRKQGVPVFVKFSARWCLTCLVNEKAALSSARIAEQFRKHGVVAFSGDWTTRNDEITSALESFGRGGVPLYVYYAPYADEPIILPQIITEGMVIELLRDL